jgi:hypothetical protein
VAFLSPSTKYWECPKIYNYTFLLLSSHGQESHFPSLSVLIGSIIVPSFDAIHSAENVPVSLRSFVSREPPVDLAHCLDK